MQTDARDRREVRGGHMPIQKICSIIIKCVSIMWNAISDGRGKHTRARHKKTEVISSSLYVCIIFCTCLQNVKCAFRVYSTGASHLSCTRTNACRMRLRSLRTSKTQPPVRIALRFWCEHVWHFSGIIVYYNHLCSLSFSLWAAGLFVACAVLFATLCYCTTWTSSGFQLWVFFLVYHRQPLGTGREICTS